ncbi:MAG: helix-turn-helix domain-containing protein [Asticcacaulis sp.]
MIRNLFGEQIRVRRRRQKWSQLELALEADITQKHLSFLETGRSMPSRDMVIRLSEVLDIPLRDRNELLRNAGFAPLYLERTLADPSLAPARLALDRVLVAHEPFPALAVDRYWNLLFKNRAVDLLLAGIRDAGLLKPPVNVIRLALHPDGLAPSIENLSQWRAHLLARVRHQLNASPDPLLASLYDEFAALPCPNIESTFEDDSGIFIPLHLNLPMGRLSFFSTTMVFGAPFDVTLSELAVEAFFPMDLQTSERLRTARL